MSTHILPGWMNDNQRAVVEDLLAKGRKLLEAPLIQVQFETGNEEAEKLLNDIGRYPHLFVLACIMDRQIKASRAWLIPYKIGKMISGFEFVDFERLTEQELVEIFTKQKLHRFNSKQATYFHSAIVDIRRKYNGDASHIWANRPRSAAVIRHFLEFKGVGGKIATMGANLLVRDFKVQMADYSSIDISPDVRVMRYFEKHGLLRQNGSKDELIYLAREINPDFPGLLDLGAWLGGKARMLKSLPNVIS